MSMLLDELTPAADANQARASRIQRAEPWLMSSPAIFTANASGLRRRPSPTRRTFSRLPISTRQG